jgi:hypothetical protein
MKIKFVLALSVLGFCSLVFGQERMGAPPAPTPEPNGFDKVRFISFVAPTGGGNTALRIKLTSLHHVDPPYTNGSTVAFTAFEGQSVWVGPPANYIEQTSNQVPFKASFTQCQPHYRDWSTVGLLHVTGSATPPSSIFHIENVDGVCQGVENTVDCQSGGINVSSQLELRTTRWGDVDLPFNPPAGSRQPDMGDTSALIKKFRSKPGALIKARALIAAQDAFGVINTPTLTNDMSLSHIAALVDAFRGNPYPYKMGNCSTRRCSNNNATTCTTNANCIAPGTCNTISCATASDCTAAINGTCNLYCP